jgi:hypothetical protein
MIAEISTRKGIYPIGETNKIKGWRIQAGSKQSYQGYFIGAGVWESSLEDSSLNPDLKS